MSKKTKGFLFGVLFSLAGILLWVLFYYFMGLIAGLATIAMALLFYTGYRMHDKETPIKKIVMYAAIVMLVEIIIAEFISIWLYIVSDLIKLSEIKTGEIIYDIVLGFAFGSFGLFLMNRQEKEARQKAEFEAARKAALFNKNNANVQDAEVIETKASAEIVVNKPAEETIKTTDIKCDACGSSKMENMGSGKYKCPFCGAKKTTK